MGKIARRYAVVVAPKAGVGWADGRSDSDRSAVSRVARCE